ncbi:MAG: hypothetical protein ACI9GW_001865 [Halieaceae bacterium]|jgi:uncharacterized protein (DUF885 family)
MRSLKTYLLVALLVACNSTQLSPEAVSTLAAGSSRLSEFFASYWEENLQVYPTMATSLGDLRYNDQYPNYDSAEFRTEDKSRTTRHLAEIGNINRDELSGQDLLSYDIFVRSQQQYLDSFRFPDWLMPVDQYNDHNRFMRLGSGSSYQPFSTVQHYEDWFNRLGRLVISTDTQIANMKLGIDRGYSQPTIIMKKVVDQYDGFVVENVEDSPLWKSITDMPDSISQPERERLTLEYRELLSESVMPAYKRMRDYLRDEYQPKCRETVGMLDLPDGKAWYNYHVKRHTTTDLTVEEIHQFGLSEVKRLHNQMQQVMTKVGFDGGLHEFFSFLQADEQFYFDSEAELFAAYEAKREEVGKLLPKAFDIFPKAGFEIRPVESFRNRTASGASYRRASPDGSKPGVFYINTYDLKAAPKYRVETLYLHEAEPGHHFAGSIQRELQGLPAFRRFGGYTAYSEGWALYVETTGKELGLFTDPYMYYGALDAQLFRAMRLVVDTGIHYYGWTRNQAIEYMSTNSSMAGTKIESEVERYISRPGQALSYKIGQREIRQMRQRAEAVLGDNFDLKAFHREVLIDGALPMDVLGSKIDRWIESKRG